MLSAAMVLGAMATNRGGEVSADVQNAKPYADPTRYETQISSFEEHDRQAPPPEGAVVCIGSSSMRGWHRRIHDGLSPLTIVPRGCGG